MSAYGSHVIKSLTFFLSFILVYYLTATTIQRRGNVEMLLKLVTVSGAAIGVLRRLRTSNALQRFRPPPCCAPVPVVRGRLALSDCSGAIFECSALQQQPIALGAVLILILPLAVYFARRSGRRWWLAALLILLGALASGSRTAVVMLICRGHRLPAPQAERDEEALACSHSRTCRRPFRIARNDRRIEGVVLPQRRTHRPAIEIRS